VKVFLIALSLLFVFPVSIFFTDAVSFASASEKRIEKKSREKTASGIVKVIDPAAKALVINGRDEVVFIAEEALLKDIRINDKVIIKYKEAGGKKYAHSVKLEQKKKGKIR
jgi:hypothetical protein